MLEIILCIVLLPLAVVSALFCAAFGIAFIKEVSKRLKKSKKN